MKERKKNRLDRMERANSPLYLFVGPKVALSVPFLGQELVLKEGSTLDYFKPVNTYLPNSLLRATS